jgi:uncharacterized HAD superfamily protein
MMEKIIWVDLDEVLSETIDGVLKFHNYKLNWIPAHKEDISNYYLWDIEKYWLTQEEGVKYFRSFLDEAQKSDEILPVQWAKEWLELLKNDWWKIVIVTARREEIKDFTIHRLDQHFKWLRDEILFASHFTVNSVEKSELCKQNWINIMIEDNLEYAIELANAWVKMYLLDKPWNNRFNPEVNKWITKFYDWTELKI